MLRLVGMEWRGVVLSDPRIYADLSWCRSSVNKARSANEVSKDGAARSGAVSSERVPLNSIRTLLAVAREAVATSLMLRDIPNPGRDE